MEQKLQAFVEIHSRLPLRVGLKFIDDLKEVLIFPRKVL